MTKQTKHTAGTRLLLLFLILVFFLPWSVSAEISLKDHRDIGPSGKLKGNICMMAVFVSTPQHPWTSSAFEKYSGTIHKAIAALNDEAQRWSVDLHAQWMYYECSLTHEITKWPDTNVDWYRELMKDFFYTDTMRELHAYLENKYDFDDTPFMFLFNSDGRSYCYCYDNGWDEEFGVIHTQEPNLQKYAVIHELLHLYGAIDIYDINSEGITAITDRYYPEAIMRDSNCITVDGLNAYLIGWRDQMSDYARSFWNDIKDKR